MKFRRLILLCILFIVINNKKLKSQILTSEDSLSAGLITKHSSTVFSGYGEAKYMYNVNAEQGNANITRQVFFVGHQFNKTFSLFTEIELANTFVKASNPLGEISLEQIFLKSNINRDIYLVTGLFIPRIGIINENHLPTTFNGNDRPFVEQLVIPSTWREIGIALYGQIPIIPGLNYSLGLMNGLKAENFNYRTGIKEGQQEGSSVNATNMALNASLLYYIHNFRIQTSGYFGGTSGLRKKTADSLRLESGIFALPVYLIESNIQYENKGFHIKVLGCLINYPKAEQLNNAYAKNMPTQIIGAYAELSYNVLSLIKSTEQSLKLFSRYEYIDLQNTIPSNTLKDDIYKIKYFVTGLVYQPIRSIAFKADYIFKNTGNYNPQLNVFNPFQYNEPVYNNNNFFNIGFAYNF